MFIKLKSNANDCTVVIVTYNSAHCLANLLGSSLSGERIIFVDNASEDGTPQAIAEAFPNASLIQQTHNVGFGAANNAALREVSTRYALLLNPDCILEEGVVSQLVEAGSHFPTAAIIAPCLTRGNGKIELSYRWPHKRWLPRGPEASGPCCVGFVSGAAMLLNMEEMRAIGFFDETFFLYYEDEDLCLRAFEKKKQIIVVPDVRLVHLSRGSAKGRNPMRSEFLRGFHHVQSKLTFEHKHYGSERAARLRWKTFALAVLSLLPRLLLPQPKYLARLVGRITGLCLPYSRISK